MNLVALVWLKPEDALKGIISAIYAVVTKKPKIIDFKSMITLPLRI